MILTAKGKLTLSCALISTLCKSMAIECWVPVCMMDAIVAGSLLGENRRKHVFVYKWSVLFVDNYGTITGHLES